MFIRVYMSIFVYFMLPKKIVSKIAILSDMLWEKIELSGFEAS
jgi:hypothetical protein